MPTLEQRASWLKDLQAQAAERVLTLGLPNARQEEWKYTALGKLDLAQLRAVKSASGFALDQRLLSEFAGADHILYFYNGEFLPRLSKTASTNELLVTSLSDALAGAEKTRETLRLFLERAPNASLGSIGEFNQSRFKDGAFIHVKSSAKVALVHFYGADSDSAFICPRHVVYVGENARVEIVEAHRFIASAGAVITTATDVVLDREAKAFYGQVVTPAEGASFFSDTQIKLSQGAELQFANISFGGKLIRNEVLCDLLEPRAAAHLFSAFAATRSQHVDNSTFIRHVKGDTISRQTVKGVASGSARGVFTGRLLIEQDAQKSDAAQLNQSLLLSTKAEVDSRPQLEVFADDVKAAHGASVGEISPEEVFYLMSRGVPRAEARHMLGRAYVAAAADAVDSTFVRAVLERAVRNISEDYFVEGAGHD